MKLSPVLLPNDAAAILEQQIVFLDQLERAPDEGTRAEALAQLRAWVVGTAAALRQADPRGKAQPAPPAASPGASNPPGEGRPAEGSKKPPCGCPEPRGPFRRPSESGLTPDSPSPVREAARELARSILGRLA